MLAALITSNSLIPILKVLLQPTGPPGFDPPKPWSRFKDLSALAKLCQALKLHSEALDHLYKQLQQLLLAPERWRWEMKQQEGFGAPVGTTAEAQLITERFKSDLGGDGPANISVQDVEQSRSMAFPEQQQREQKQQQTTLNARAVAPLPESVMNWFGPQAKEQHALSVVGSCSPVQLLLIPVHCFRWLSDADKAACLQTIQVRTSTRT
jgi:hypothetical protein